MDLRGHLPQWFSIGSVERYVIVIRTGSREERCAWYSLYLENSGSFQSEGLVLGWLVVAVFMKVLVSYQMKVNF